MRNGNKAPWIQGIRYQTIQGFKEKERKLAFRYNEANHEAE